MTSQGKGMMVCRTVFSSVSYSGYKLDVLKSGLQKYMRRRESEKMMRCMAELDYFSECEENGKKGIRTNMMNRMKVFCFEELLFTEVGKFLCVMEMLKKWDGDERKDKKLLVGVCDILVNAEIVRIVSDLKNYWWFGVRQYGYEDEMNRDNSDADLSKVLKYVMKTHTITSTKLKKTKKIGDNKEVVKDLAKFIEKLDEKSDEVFFWMFEIVIKAIDGVKGGKRYKRDDCDYIIWDVLFDKCNGNKMLKKCLDIALKEYFIKTRTLKGDRTNVIVSAVLWVMRRDEIKWEEFTCDSVSDKKVKSVYNFKKEFEVDDFVMDKHCASGRAKGKTVLDFAKEGCKVVNENEEWFVKKYRDAYVEMKRIQSEKIVKVKKSPEKKVVKVKKSPEKKVVKVKKSPEKKVVKVKKSPEKKVVKESEEEFVDDSEDEKKSPKKKSPKKKSPKKKVSVECIQDEASKILTELSDFDESIAEKEDGVKLMKRLEKVLLDRGNLSHEEKEFVESLVAVENLEESEADKQIREYRKEQKHKHKQKLIDVFGDDLSDLSDEEDEEDEVNGIKPISIISESDLPKVEFSKFEDLSPCTVTTCGGKAMCFSGMYEGRKVVLKEGRESMNYNRDYMVVNSLKNLFNLTPLVMSRIRLDKVSKKIDKEKKSWEDNYKWVKPKESIVYTLMDFIEDGSSVFDQKDVILEEESFLIELIKIGMFRGIFRVSDFNLKNVFVNSNNDLVSIDEHNINKRDKVFGKFLTKSIKEKINKEMIDGVLEDLNSNIGGKMEAIRHKMRGYQFSEDSINRVEKNYGNLKKDIYEELNF